MSRLTTKQRRARRRGRRGWRFICPGTVSSGLPLLGYPSSAVCHFCRWTFETPVMGWAGAEIANKSLMQHFRSQHRGV